MAGRIDKIKCTFYLSKDIKEAIDQLAYSTRKPRGTLLDEILGAFFGEFEQNLTYRGVLLSRKRKS